MPTLPLFDRSAAPGNWHAVASPGGYDAWSLDAEDPATDTQVSAVVTTGAQQWMAYLKRYDAFRRSPTRRPPPVPGDYAGVLLSVYRAGKLLRRSFTPGEVKLADAALDLSIGRARLSRSDGAWKLSAYGVELAFTPTLSAVPATPVLGFLRRTHEWSPVAPRCSVKGSIDGAGFNGVGSVEHAFGAAPVAFGMARLIRGRVFFGDSAILFHIARHRSARRPHEATLLHVTTAGVADLHEATIDGPYAEVIRFGDRLTLTEPQIIDAQAHSVRVAYTADWQGTHGVAHCDVFYPQPPRRSFKRVLADWLTGGD